MARGPKASGVRWVVLAVAISATADAVTTWDGLHRGMSEQNGAAAGLFHALGVFPVLALRVLIPVALAWTALRFTSRLRPRDRVIHYAACGGILFVAAMWMLVAASNRFGWL